MNFHEKFTYLMELTATKNKQIADAINVDPSVISRIRNGKRKIPPNSEYTKLIANYFTGHCTAEFQRDAIKEVTGNNNINFSNKAATSNIIESWMMNEQSTAQIKVAELLHSFDNLTVPILPSSIKDDSDINTLPKNNNQVFVYYGEEGKQRANLQFEDLILSSDKVCNINIITEGNTEWLWKDRKYAAQVSTNIEKAVLKGCTINRIHPRNQSLPLAFDTVRRWLPLYMTGRVTSYYYPFLRDNIFNRTLYVASGIAALVSTSVGEKHSGNLTYLVTNPNIVDCYNQEFADFLEFCQPATTVYNYSISATSLLKCINGFYAHNANCICINDGLSYISAPKELFAIVAEHKNLSIQKLILEHALRLSQLEKLLEEQSYTEIFCLDSFEDVVSGNVSFLPFSGYRTEPLFYTPDLYILHLKNIIYLLKKHTNYNVILLDHKEFESSIFVKEGYSVLAVSHKEPLTITKIEYTEMVTAIWEYVKTKTIDSSKTNVIASINNFICSFEDYIKRNN